MMVRSRIASLGAAVVLALLFTSPAQAGRHWWDLADSASAPLIMPPSPAAVATDGTWTSTASGFWAGSGNWAGGNIADGNGATANFTANLGATISVVLDTQDWTVGFMNVGDVDGTGAYN